MTRIVSPSFGRLPAVDAAIRFVGELKCQRLQPQLLAILKQLSQTGTVEAADQQAPAPDTMSTSATAPPASFPPASAVTSATSDEACKRDEERLAQLQAKPSIEEALRLEDEFTCSRLQPQIIALLDSFSQAPQPERLPSSSEASPNPTSAGETALPASEPPAASTATPATGAPGSNESPIGTAVGSIADAERRIAALESDKEALAAEVSRLQHDREAPSAEQATGTPSPQPASPEERSGAEAASQAAVDAERRIAELESEKVALTAEVGELQRDREVSPAEQAKPIPPPLLAAPAERSNAEPAAALASLPEGMPARVLIRYLNNGDARAQAEKLASALAAQGVEVADVRESRSAIRTELSFSYAPDEAIARQVGRLMGVAPVRRLQPKDALMIRPGTVELNLSGDSHLAVIKTTSIRESKHE